MNARPITAAVVLAAMSGACEVLSGLDSLSSVDALPGASALSRTVDAAPADTSSTPLRLDASWRGSDGDASQHALGTDAGGDEDPTDAADSGHDAGTSHDAGANHDADTRHDAGVARDGGSPDILDASPKPDARKADSGCGPLDSVDNCGACGVVCNESTAVEVSCLASTCTYTCMEGRANCDTAAPDENGCECNTPGCCGSSCETIHSNGMGGTYDDCAAPSTYDATEALEACTSFTGNALSCEALACASAICSVGSSTACVCWSYAGSSAGHLRSSGQPGAETCACPTATDPTWN